jgi:hypothetical protein
MLPVWATVDGWIVNTGDTLQCADTKCNSVCAAQALGA